MRTRTRATHINHHQKIAVWVLLGVLVGAGVVYGYLINQTVVNVVKNEQLETDMTILATHISELEFDYINKKNEITLDFALAHGFNEIEEPRYISRTAPRRALTLDTR